MNVFLIWCFVTGLSVLRERSVQKGLKFGGPKFSCQLPLPWLSVSRHL